MTVIETKRLVLRPFARGDVDDLYEYAKNPQVGYYAGWKPHESKRESREVLNTVFLDQENVWAIVWRSTDKVIGSIGLVSDPKRENAHVRMLGYAVGENYWDRGIMTEAVGHVLAYAFGELDLSMVSAYCFPFNERSKRILAKFGFRYEGTLHKAERLYTGEIVDHLCYGLAQADYWQAIDTV